MKGMKLHKEQVVLAANQRVQSEKAETPEAPTDAKVCLARSGVVVLLSLPLLNALKSLSHSLCLGRRRCMSKG